MPLYLRLENFPECPKCNGKKKQGAPTVKLVPIYEFSGGSEKGGSIPVEILYWKCSNPECKVTIEP